jgi:hypothetical protein
MAQIEVVLTDTFDEWRQKTNQLSGAIGDIVLLSEFGNNGVDSLTDAINDLDERTAIGNATLKDADSDTKIEVEKTTDEDKIRFSAAGSERIVIESNKVNIINGTNSSGASVDASVQLNIDSNADSGLQISSGATSLGKILFGDSGNSSIGSIEYNHNNNTFNFTTNGVQSVSITNTGKLDSTNLGNTDNLTTTATNITDAINEVKTSVAGSGSSSIPFIIALG